MPSIKFDRACQINLLYSYISNKHYQPIAGIRPTEFTGSFFMSNTTDVELASMASDQSLTIEVKYDDKLTEEEGVYIQCAVLYTSCSGQRRLRVHNMALNTCSQLAELFRNCELDTILNVFLKEGEWLKRIIKVKHGIFNV